MDVIIHLEETTCHLQRTHVGLFELNSDQDLTTRKEVISQQPVDQTLFAVAATM